MASAAIVGMGPPTGVATRSESPLRGVCVASATHRARKNSGLRAARRALVPEMEFDWLWATCRRAGYDDLPVVAIYHGRGNMIAPWQRRQAVSNCLSKLGARRSACGLSWRGRR